MPLPRQCENPVSLLETVTASDCSESALPEALHAHRAHAVFAARNAPPEILPLTLRVLFRLPCTAYMRGTFIAALLGEYLEKNVNQGEKIEGSAPRRTRLAGSKAEATASDIQQRLSRLMPFEEWCATLKPTEAAKELYWFVRERLEMRAAEALTRLQGTPPRGRPRKAKSRSAEPTEQPSDKQRQQ